MYETELALINTGRAALDLQPLSSIPLGIPRSATLCPLAAALDHRVVADRNCVHSTAHDNTDARLAKAWATAVCARLSNENNPVGAELPEALKCFVEAFDLGLINLA